MQETFFEKLAFVFACLDSVWSVLNIWAYLIWYYQYQESLEAQLDLCSKPNKKRKARERPAEVDWENWTAQI
jgi:hypothetical protein